MPAATQWEIVEEEAELIQPAHAELIRQAAQGAVLYNDDTSMRVLRLEREPDDERTGVFTSGFGTLSHPQIFPPALLGLFRKVSFLWAKYSSIAFSAASTEG